MKKQPAIIRCFIALCFSSAIALIAIEWKDPFSGAVVTPASLANVSGDPPILVETSESNAQQVASDDGATRRRGLWERPSRTKAAVQSPVQLSLSLEGRYLEVTIPGQPSVRYDVAVGQDAWQTPTGTFHIMNKLEDPAWQHPITKEEIPPGPDNPLGTRWIGFWTDGTAQIGFHGTNQEELIGEAVSHGCVRMRNADIQELYKLVEIGTTVEVSQ
ncbi:MAG: L,D-transpeptidase [Cyanobacteria bacterium J06627_28]